jgi:glyoxylase-like metal-dependent hydrolase (beta-lactamase superfamily II)
MRELADGVMQLAGKPANSINAYLVGDVLIDSGAPWTGKSVVKQLKGVELNAHAITHAHFDHYGGSRAVCDAYDVPFWVGEIDAPATERGKQVFRVPGLGPKLVPAARAKKADRLLKEGDEVAGFKVLLTPGHSPGHLSFWRESDRVLLCGDVMWGMDPFTMRKAITDPYAALSPDPKLNRESAKRLADLRPELVCFGHGPPLRDPDKFAAAVAKSI